MQQFISKSKLTTLIDAAMVRNCGKIKMINTRVKKLPPGPT